MSEPGAELRFEPRAAGRLPLLEVRGTPYALGVVAGRRFGAELRHSFAEPPKGWRELKAFVDAQPPALLEGFVAAARRHAPDALDELRGWADGARLPLRELLVFNLRAELGTLRERAGGSGGAAPRAERSDQGQRAGGADKGCSTIVHGDGERLLLAHNEDGDATFSGHMFLLHARPEGKPAFLAVCYPGVLPGNAPWINERGVLMTTNYIHSAETRPGVGRYFLDRLAMQARSLDEALAICTHRERAYAFHHVIGSAREGRAVALEVTPRSFARRELSAEIYLHTNHLVLEPLARGAADPEDVRRSSHTRLEVLARWRAGTSGRVREEDLLRALGSHEGRPYSPCRHPEGSVRGATLATALFNIPTRGANATRVRIWCDQPCRGQVRELGWSLSATA